MKSFADHPKAHLWSDKNKLKPHQVSYGSAKKFYFDCDTCKHQYFTSCNVVTMTRSWLNAGCPYCSTSHPQFCDNECEWCFKRSFASYPKSKYWSKKNTIDARHVSIRSSKKYWFDCDECDHDFHKAPGIIVRPKISWCPYCARKMKSICNDKTCQDCFKRSFASHPRAKDWSQKNKLKPRDVSSYTSKKYWFDCDKCGHDYNMTPAHINEGNGCPYCQKYAHKLCKKESCKYCFKRSYASHPRAKDWSHKNKLKPRQVALGSHNKYWFDCDKCSHEFHRMAGSERQCPYCAGQKLCDKETCQDCFKQSFASHPKAKCWSKKNKLKPRQVASHTYLYRVKYWFDCDKGSHEFYTSPQIISMGCWCPICVNKTEKKLLEWLQKQTFIKKVKHQYKPEWCSTEYQCIIKEKPKTRRYQYSYDFLVTLKNGKQIIIELDGRQHFKQVSNWNGPLHNQIRDAYKERKARQHKIPVIRILQEDVWYDRGDWESELTTKLI